MSSDVEQPRVASSNVAPRLMSLVRRLRFKICALSGSKPLKASSSKINFGSPTNARRTASFCRVPSDKMSTKEFQPCGPIYTNYGHDEKEQGCPSTEDADPDHSGRRGSSERHHDQHRQQRPRQDFWSQHCKHAANRPDRETCQRRHRVAAGRGSMGDVARPWTGTQRFWMRDDQPAAGAQEGSQQQGTPRDEAAFCGQPGDGQHRARQEAEARDQYRHGDHGSQLQSERFDAADAGTYRQCGQPRPRRARCMHAPPV